MADQLVVAAHVHFGGVIVHRLPRQPGQGRGVDAQLDPQALPPLSRHRLSGTVPSGHLTRSQQSSEQDLAGIPQQLLVLRHTASRRGRGQQFPLQLLSPR